MDELYQNLVRLSPKEQVPFRCIGCGECCRHVHMQVPVETLDAFRIVKHLQQQGEDIVCMDDFWIRYTEPALLNECGFFVYFLKTQGPEEACPPYYTTLPQNIVTHSSRKTNTRGRKIFHPY